MIGPGSDKKLQQVSSPPMYCLKTPPPSLHGFFFGQKQTSTNHFAPKIQLFSPRRTSLRKAISLRSNTSEIQIQLYVIILATLITALLSLGDGGIFDSNVVDSGDVLPLLLDFVPVVR